MDARGRKRMADAVSSLKAEATVLERLLYQFSNAFSKEKLYRSLKQTSKRVHFVLDEISGTKDLTQGNAESKAILQKNLEDVKLRSALAAHHAETRVKTGHHWPQWALVLGICSRVWCLAEFFLRVLSGDADKRPSVPSVIPAESFISAPIKQSEPKMISDGPTKEDSPEPAEDVDEDASVITVVQKERKSRCSSSEEKEEQIVPSPVASKGKLEKADLRNLPTPPSKKRSLDTSIPSKHPTGKKRRREEMKKLSKKNASKKNPRVKAVCGSWSIL